MSLPPVPVHQLTRGGRDVTHGVRLARARRRAASCTGSQTQPAETSTASKGQKRLAKQKGLGEAPKTYILAAGVLDIRAVPAPSPTVAVVPQKRSHQVPAQAVKTDWQILS